MEHKWYVIHTYTGHEDKVKASLEKIVETRNLKSKIARVLIPTEEVVEIKKNKRRVAKRKFFPSYILVEMVIDDETYWTVQNIPGVTGFLGGIRPVPLRDKELNEIMELVEQGSTAKPKPAVIFEKDETVRIIDGPFANFVGVVEEVNEEKGKLKAMVTIFGRQTPVELDFLQVERM